MQILKGTLFFPAMMKNRSLAKTLKGTGYVGCGRDILTRRWMVSMGCGLNSEDLWQNAQLCGRLEASTDVHASLQKNNIQVNQVKNWICGLFLFFLLWDIWIQQQSKCYNKRLSILTRNSLRWINFFFFPADSCLPTALNRAFLHYYKVPHSQTIRSVPAHFFDNENGGYNTGPFRVPIHLFRFEVVLLVLKHFCPVRFTMMFL